VKLLLETWRQYLKENLERKVNIFLDMDGVLVDFTSALKDHIKRVYHLDADAVHPDSKSSRQTLRRLQRLNLSEERIEELYYLAEKRFVSGTQYKPEEKLMSRYILKSLLGNKELWLSMNKLEGADTLVKKAFDLADEVFVLTAQVDDTSEEAKREWITNHFPQINPQNVNVDRNKGGRLLQLMDAGAVSREDLNILIDDRKRFLDSFIGAGGVGIQYDSQSPQIALSKLERTISN
jgi:5'(3')-deoxyribonucleotidase